MRGKPKKGPREKDLTARYLSGDMDLDRIDRAQRFSHRNANAEAQRILRTTLLRAEEAADAGDVESLPVGQVIQVFSLYCEIEHEGSTYLGVIRKTLTRVMDTAVIVGDYVRFRPESPDRASPAPAGPPSLASTPVRAPRSAADLANLPQAVIEQVLPRRTILTRTESFKGVEQHPIVANADQMLIVASIFQPTVRWGLIDRMIVAALSGKLSPIVCLNKMDLAADADADQPALLEAREVLAHYAKLSIACVQTSAVSGQELDRLRAALAGKSTVLAGHSGVGKSRLINALHPELNITVGAISGYTGKGRHTTTSARHYRLRDATVIDTPGVKLFGLWGVSRENLIDYFPDVADDSAPQWRKESYLRIAESLGE